jgi:RNA polymerase sigma-70 factor, ECF subfamily
VNDRPSAPGFRILFEEHFSYVWSVLRRLGVGNDDVEDLAHEVFLNVYRHFSDYDPARPVRPWLFGFAFHVASDDRRRAHRRREVFGTEVVASDPTASADDALVRAEERSLLMRALDQIELDRRAVLVLHEWDDCTIPEVARALGIPLNTAYTRLRLARADLAAAVKRLTSGGLP